MSVPPNDFDEITATTTKDEQVPGEGGRSPTGVRSRAAWTSEIARMGYEVVDTWEIPDLGHVIPTHPWLGRSESRGVALRRVGA